MVWVGGDLKTHLIPSPYHRQRHLPLSRLLKPRPTWPWTNTSRDGTQLLWATTNWRTVKITLITAMVFLHHILWLLSLMHCLPGKSSHCFPSHFPILPLPSCSPHCRGATRPLQSGSSCASLAPTIPLTPGGWCLQHQIWNRKLQNRNYLSWKLPAQLICPVI